MNSKERVLMALARKKPDRVPFNFWMDRRLMEHYQAQLGHRHWRVTHYGADVIETFAMLNWPQGPGVEKDGTFWHTEPYFDDWRAIEDIPLPDPHDPKVYSRIQADVAEFAHTAIFLDVITPWGVIAGMRTYERIYMDMYEFAEAFHSLSRRILNIQKVVVEQACKDGITALYLMEDLATSKGLSMSPAMIKEFCLDYTVPLIQIAKSYEKPVLFHSDGYVFELAELLCTYKIDAMNPLQPTLNDADLFKSRYGSKMTVYGGLDNCFIIPSGTPSEIRFHVQNIFEKLGKPDGGLIFSTHDIPLLTPSENIETLVDQIKQCVY